MKEIISYSTHIISKTEIKQADSLKEINEFLFIRFSNIYYFIDDRINIKEEISSILLNRYSMVESGEAVKSLESYFNNLKLVQEKNINKNSAIVVIGGGALTDAIGYLASTFLRGISYVVIPSTFLGMVDAGIGGKNGINLGNAKNQVGTIYQPEFIFYLKTLYKGLPEIEIYSGMAEVIKYALLFDENFLSEIEVINLSNLMNDVEIAMKVVEQCARWKAKIVEKDPQDLNERKILNFGHTFGHAIEVNSNLRHGHAVAMGILIALKVSEIKVGFDKDTYKRIHDLFSKFQLISEIEWNIDRLMKNVERDKKNMNGIIDYIVLEKLGSPRIMKIPLLELQSLLTSIVEEKWI